MDFLPLWFFEVPFFLSAWSNRPTENIAPIINKKLYPCLSSARNEIWWGMTTFTPWAIHCYNLSDTFGQGLSGLISDMLLINFGRENWTGGSCEIWTGLHVSTIMVMIQKHGLIRTESRHFYGIWYFWVCFWKLLSWVAELWTIWDLQNTFSPLKLESN